MKQAHLKRVAETAKIVRTGRSQAIRLPKEFQFDSERVRIRRHGKAVILEPVSQDWSWLDALSGKLDVDFVKAVGEKAAPQKRPALDKLFR